MAEDGKRVEVRMGTFACTIEGYDDPISKLKEVMGLVQQMISETPALVDVSADVDNAEVQEALDAQSEPVRMRKADRNDEEIETIPDDPVPDSETDGDFTLAAAAATDVVTDGTDLDAEAVGVVEEDLGTGDVAIATEGARADDDPTVAAKNDRDAVNIFAEPDENDTVPEADRHYAEVTESKGLDRPTDVPDDRFPETSAAFSGTEGTGNETADDARPEDTGTGRRLYGLGRFAAALTGRRRGEAEDAETEPAPNADTPKSEDTAADNGASAPDPVAAPDRVQPAEEETFNIFADAPTPDSANQEPPASPTGDPASYKTGDGPGSAFLEPLDDYSTPAESQPLETAVDAFDRFENGDTADRTHPSAHDPAEDGELDNAADAAAFALPDDKTEVEAEERAAGGFRSLFSPRSRGPLDAGSDERYTTIFDSAEETATGSTPSDEADVAETAEKDSPLRNIFADPEDEREPETDRFPPAPESGAGVDPFAPPVTEDDETPRVSAIPMNSAGTATRDVPAAETGDDRFGALLDRLHAGVDDNSVPRMGAPGEEGEETAAAPEAAGVTAADLAEISGAETVADMLSASAAWLTLTEGKLRFSRRDVMDVFEGIPGEHPKTLEARIKGYGKLVRSGTLVLIGDGQFALAQPERDRFKALLS